MNIENLGKVRGIKEEYETVLKNIENLQNTNGSFAMSKYNDGSGWKLNPMYTDGNDSPVYDEMRDAMIDVLVERKEELEKIISKL